jgi:hypothetical protein
VDYIFNNAFTCYFHFLPTGWGLLRNNSVLCRPPSDQKGPGRTNPELLLGIVQHSNTVRTSALNSQCRVKGLFYVAACETKGSSARLGATTKKVCLCVSLRIRRGVSPYIPYIFVTLCLRWSVLVGQSELLAVKTANLLPVGAQEELVKEYTSWCTSILCPLTVTAPKRLGQGFTNNQMMS